MLGDANLWVNTGGSNDSDSDIRRTLREMRELPPQKVNYEKVDLSEYDYEIYLVEKPFFNVPTLFISVVLEHKTEREMEYIRPAGHYWDLLPEKYQGDKDIKNINNEIKYYPEIYVKNGNNPIKKKVYPLNLYGHHHPERPHFELRGGTCPSRGGDWSTYPLGNSGGGWPNNYQEITPMCDGFLIDLKVWTNLWEDSWYKPEMGLGNAGFPGAQVIAYKVHANLYGEFTDPYNVGRGKQNPHALRLISGTKPRDPKKGDPSDTIIIHADFMRPSHPIKYIPVPELNSWVTHNLSDKCLEIKNACKDLQGYDLTFFDHAGAAGTEHNWRLEDPKYLTSISHMPLLPRFNGYIGSHGEKIKVFCTCILYLINLSMKGRKAFFHRKEQ